MASLEASSSSGGAWEQKRRVWRGTLLLALGRAVVESVEVGPSVVVETFEVDVVSLVLLLWGVLLVVEDDRCRFPRRGLVEVVSLIDSHEECVAVCFVEPAQLPVVGVQ